MGIIAFILSLIAISVSFMHANSFFMLGRLGALFGHGNELLTIGGGLFLSAIIGFTGGLLALLKKKGSALCFAIGMLLCLGLWYLRNSSNLIFTGSWWSSVEAADILPEVWDFIKNSQVSDFLICAGLYFISIIFAGLSGGDKEISPPVGAHANPRTHSGRYIVPPAPMQVGSTRCKQCGNELRPGERFCASCGTRMDED